jgi:guanylate kinase
LPRRDGFAYWTLRWRYVALTKSAIRILTTSQGVKQVANHPTFPRPRFLFLSPPSMEILEQRLRSRATDKEEAILKRLKQAKNEMDFANSGEAPHDKVVVNDDLDQAYKEVKEFIVRNDA